MASTDTSDFDPKAPVQIAGCVELRVGLRGKTLKLIPKTKKKNPNSLRFLIGHIVNFFFGGERREAANQMRRDGGSYASNRKEGGPKVLDEEMLSKILYDGTYIDYWQLEAIARAVETPSGALLLLSRMYSLLREKRNEPAEALIRGIHQFADELERLRQNPVLTEEVLRRVSGCFSETNRLESEPVFF
jgi:hypothetical protein